MRRGLILLATIPLLLPLGGASGMQRSLISENHDAPAPKVGESGSIEFVARSDVRGGALHVSVEAPHWVRVDGAENWSVINGAEPSARTLRVTPMHEGFWSLAVRLTTERGDRYQEWCCLWGWSGEEDAAWGTSLREAVLPSRTEIQITRELIDERHVRTIGRVDSDAAWLRFADLRVLYEDGWEARDDRLEGTSPSWSFQIAREIPASLCIADELLIAAVPHVEGPGAWRAEQGTSEPRIPIHEARSYARAAHGGLENTTGEACHALEDAVAEHRRLDHPLLGHSSLRDVPAPGAFCVLATLGFVAGRRRPRSGESSCAFGTR